MTVPAPNTLEFGLTVNSRHKEARVEGIWKLAAAKNHLFQGHEEISGKAFLQRRASFTSPMGMGVEVSQLSIAEVEGVAFKHALFGPSLCVIETDVNLSDDSIRKRDEDLVL